MKNSLFRSAAMHGLIIGLALIIVSLSDWALGFYGQNMAFSLLTYVVIIGGLIWSAIDYRNKALGGYISYGKALSYSIVVAVFFSIFSAVFGIILTELIDPDYMATILFMMEEKFLDLGMPGAQVDMMMGMYEKMMHPAISFVITIFSTVFVSAIIALITSAIVKKNNPNPFEQQTF